MPSLFRYLLGGSTDKVYVAPPLQVGNRPRLNWDSSIRKGVLESQRWGHTPKEIPCVSLIDEIDECDRIALVLEPGIPRKKKVSVVPEPSELEGENDLTAYGYFFTKNDITGAIDMLLRSKPLRGVEERTLFRDITYFGVKFQQEETEDNNNDVYSSCFVVTFERGQIYLPSGSCFQLKDYQRLDLLLARINCVIASSLSTRQDLNTNLFPYMFAGTPDEAMDLPLAPSRLVVSDDRIHQRISLQSTSMVMGTDCVEVSSDDGQGIGGNGSQEQPYLLVDHVEILGPVEDITSSSSRRNSGVNPDIDDERKYFNHVGGGPVGSVIVSSNSSNNNNNAPSNLFRAKIFPLPPR